MMNDETKMMKLTGETMNDQIKRLVDRFNLTDDIEKFVKEKAKELSTEKQVFHLVGSCESCGSSTPHIPHVTGEYNTVHYGMLQRFCLGQSGDGLEVVVQKRTIGSAETPSRATGYYIIK